MTGFSTRHGSIWTRLDWAMVLLVTLILTVSVFLGSMAAFYVQGWSLLRGLP